MDELVIREIQAEDNEEIAALIRKILEDMGVPKVGTAYADKALDNMYAEYLVEKSSYFVATTNGIILGCSGIAPLQNSKENICELQKMYVSEDARGKGVGKQLIEVCIQKAKEYGFKACYLETTPYMEAAQQLYKKSGFQCIQERMGNTGHHSCPVFMIKYL